ncbi:unnamed protein product, partial [marine sediment metagenome]
DEERIEKNLNLTKGACLSEKIMLNLVEKGIGRQEGHEILRKAAIKAKKENRFIKEILLENKNITESFTKDEIDNLLNPHNYIGKSLELLEKLIKFLKNKHNL